MRNFFILVKHELRMLMISPPTYIAAVLFLLLMGFLYWSIIRSMVSTPEESLPFVQFLRIFWIPVFFVVPLLTMRSIADERNIGTLETLMTTPTSKVAMVLSKFFSAYSFYMLLWLSTLGFPLITARFFSSATSSMNLLELAPVIGSFAFLALSGILFISIGIFASSITRSQLVAGMFSFTALFMAIIGGPLLLASVAQSSVELPSLFDEMVNYLQIFNHLDDFSRGVIDTRPFFYYSSTGVLMLGLSILMTETKN